MQVIFFRRNTISANLIGVVRDIACPVKLEDVCSVRRIVFQDRLQHGIDRRVKIGRQHQIFDALYQLALCGKVLLCRSDFGDIVFHADGKLHAARSAAVVDDGVMEHNIAHSRMMAHPCMPLPLTVRQNLVGAKLTGRRYALQMLIALGTRLEAAEFCHAIAVQIQHFIGIQIADVDGLIDLIQYPPDVLCIHSSFSSVMVCIFSRRTRPAR